MIKCANCGCEIGKCDLIEGVSYCSDCWKNFCKEIVKANNDFKKVSRELEEQKRISRMIEGCPEKGE